MPVALSVAPSNQEQYTGIIVTKLDGTGKGGALAGIYRELKLPILYVGLGERAEDLQKFNIRAYANGVFGLEQ